MSDITEVIARGVPNSSTPHGQGAGKCADRMGRTKVAPDCGKRARLCAVVVLGAVATYLPVRSSFALRE